MDESLARRLANIVHIPLGSQGFQATEKLLREMGFEPEGAEELIRRLNLNTTQASELVWKFMIFINTADLVLVDTKMLDTAVGQHFLETAKQHGRPVWAVGVDAGTSPIAPYFLRGIIYPGTPDDLVKLILQETVKR